MTSIKYPDSIKSNKDRYAFLYRLEELLRLEHNKKGTDFREGRITEQKWEDYKNNIFEPKSQLIASDICKYRKMVGFVQHPNLDESVVNTITEHRKQSRENTSSIAKLSDVVI